MALDAGAARAASLPEPVALPYLEIDGTTPSRLASARGGFPQMLPGDYSVVATPLVLQIPVGVSKPISDWLVQGSVRSLASIQRLAVVRVNASGVVDRLVLASPQVREVEIQGFGSDPAPIELRVELVSNPIEVRVEGASPMATPTSPRQAIGQLSFGGLQVQPITVDGVGTRFGTDGFGKWTPVCSPFAITSPHADAAGLYEWYAASVLKGSSRGTPTPRTAELSLVDADGKVAPLASVAGVIITSFETYSEPDGIMRVKASFACTGFTLAKDAFR